MHADRLVFYLAATSLAAISFGQQNVADQPPFGASPADLQKAFSTISAGSNHVTILLDSGRFDLESAGQLIFKHRMIFKVWTKQAASGWGTIQRSFSPWQDDRPEIHARVISPDGSVHELDQSTLAEAPVKDGDDDLISDRRLVRAPLPAMEIGAIVEQETVERQRTPTLAAGMLRYFYFGDNVPVERSHLTIRAPQSLPLRYKTFLLPNVVVTERAEGGFRQVDFSQGPMKPVEKSAPLLPPNEPRQAHIVFSTASSWQALANEYSAIVDKQIKGFNAASFLPKFPAGATREAKIRAVVEKINREIRYTGLEFGEASVVPRTPSEVLQRKYGDCKDTAALTVALLRAAGIEAHSALLLSSLGEDIDPDLAGIDAFDHEIVYAPGAPDYWLDLTDPDLRVGVISPDNQGRWSMIARPSTTAPLRIPEFEADQNRIVETREFVLPELGRAKIIETTETYGLPDREYRASFGSRMDKELRDSLKNYVETTYGEAKIGKISPGDAADLEKPFTLRVELEDAQRGSSGRTEAAVGIFVSYITARLPQFFRTDPKDQDDDEATGKDALDKGDKKESPRTQDFQIAEPYTHELHYKITAPPGFRLRQLPEAKEEEARHRHPEHEVQARERHTNLR